MTTNRFQLNVRPMAAIVASLALLVAGATLMVAADSVTAAGPPKPKTGKWKIKKDSSDDTKGGTFKVTAKSKKVKRLKMKPKADKIDSCGSAKPVKLVGSLPIKFKNGSWRVSNKEATYGRKAKFKQGSKTYRGSLWIQFANAQSGVGMLVTGEPGCYMYFNIKR